MDIPVNFNHKLEVRATLAALKTTNPAAKLAEAYEAMATQYGFQSWNVMSAALKRLKKPVSVDAEVLEESLQRRLWKIDRDPRSHIIIVGSTGAGKSVLAHSLAKELGEKTHSKPVFVFARPSAPKFIHDMWRAGECVIKTYHLIGGSPPDFDYIVKLRNTIVVIDELDAVLLKRDATLGRFLDYMTGMGCFVVGCLNSLPMSPYPLVDLHLMKADIGQGRWIAANYGFDPQVLEELRTGQYVKLRQIRPGINVFDPVSLPDINLVAFDSDLLSSIWDGSVENILSILLEDLPDEAGYNQGWMDRSVNYMQALLSALVWARDTLKVKITPEIILSYSSLDKIVELSLGRLHNGSVVSLPEYVADALEQYLESLGVENDVGIINQEQHKQHGYRTMMWVQKLRAMTPRNS